MKLHEQVEVYKEFRLETIQGIRDIKRYLHLDKFSTDIMVNKNDILLRLNELDNALILIDIKLS